MGITLIEQIGIVAGIVIGVSSFIYSVLQARYQKKYEREQAAEQALKDRLYFLANLIVDKDIPRSSRQIFFDEYIAKGGNGSFVKHWYNEEKERESKKGG
ncbi:MAG: hypothetical protein LBF74_13600 [Treponema sp.]|jgi:hypothetical protein|nr:hypothetical protein [Treponema sp.]